MFPPQECEPEGKGLGDITYKYCLGDEIRNTWALMMTSNELFLGFRAEPLVHNVDSLGPPSILYG